MKIKLYIIPLIIISYSTSSFSEYYECNNIITNIPCDSLGKSNKQLSEPPVLIDKQEILDEAHLELEKLRKFGGRLYLDEEDLKSYCKAQETTLELCRKKAIKLVKDALVLSEKNHRKKRDETRVIIEKEKIHQRQQALEISRAKLASKSRNR